ncbi:SGNH/GDSL hydrolase family protein [Oleisolibacter albus]|uniref:SGNH/GDSL hydrolase family protein n=1 Tax=Oleisolibacter albus TaxID=2171757 RepID=UPI0013905A2E|nr:hypothetical protein [Oleisolibacter albus]
MSSGNAGSMAASLGIRVAKLLLSLVFAFAAGEMLVRIATSSQDHYVIEMWRYANLLQRATPARLPGHEHRPGTAADLQHVHVRINNLGLRGPDVDMGMLKGKKVIVLLGDSLTFGWGVPESETLAGQLQERLGADFAVLNAGIGNMNLEQLAARWHDLNAQLSPDLLVVLPTMRATDPQQEGRASLLVRNSQLAALASSFISQVAGGVSGREDLTTYYRRHWTGQEMTASLDRAFRSIADDRSKGDYKVLFAMMPETNDFINYPYDFATEIIQRRTEGYGWNFIDLFPLFKGEPAQKYWVSSYDIHLNGAAFAKMQKPISEKILYMLSSDAN